MTQVLFVRITSYVNEQFTHPHNLLPPLDIGYAAALLEKQGIKSTFIDFPLQSVTNGEILSLVEKQNIGYVFIKFTTPSFPRATKLAQSLEGKATVIGLGQHPSSLPQSCLDNGFAACIRGEAEEMILRVVTEQNHMLDSMAYKHNGKLREGNVLTVDSLKHLPLPKHEWFVGNYFSHYITGFTGKAKWGFVQATRGCPHPCPYCSPTLRTSWGKKLRKRNPKSVVDEFNHLQEMGVNLVWFMDDNLGGDRDYLMRLCAAMEHAEITIKWVIQMRADSIDKELLTEMKNAGCVTVCVGVESGSNNTLKTLRKGYTIDTPKAAFRHIHEAGLYSTAFFMIGSPGETEEDIRQSMSLMKELQPDLIQVSFFTAYPGSPAYEDMKDKNDFTRFLHYNSQVSNQSQVSDERLRQLQNICYRQFYFTPQFISRYARNRFSYLLKNPRRELGIILNSLKFLARSKD